MSESAAHEAAPLVVEVEEGEPRESAVKRLFSWTIARIFGLIALWYFFSTSLSLFNKKLFGKEHGLFGHSGFPAPLFMTSVQFFCQYLLARAVLGVGLVPRAAKNTEDRTWKEYCRNVLPNGLSTGLDIGFSNMSLQTITLSFYVMCKSTTPMFLLLFAFIWRIEKPSWSLAGVVLTISSGILLLVYGETKFELQGFLLVMLAACLAGLRWTLTQVLLQGGENKEAESHGGPLEILQQLTPVMAITVLSLSLVLEQLFSLPESGYFHTWEHTAITFLLIMFSAVLAFLMVWAEFQVIKETSALTFMVAGTCKEIVTVLAAVILFGEDFGLINALGLVILIGGVSLYNYFKYTKVKSGEAKLAPRRQRKGQGLHRDESAMYLQLSQTDSDGEKLKETITSTNHRHKVPPTIDAPAGDGAAMGQKKTEGGGGPITENGPNE